MTRGLGCVLLFLASAGAVHAVPLQEETRILLIGHKPDHPPGTHMYLPGSRLLARCLEQTPGVKAVVSDRWPKDPKVLEGVKAIVLYTSPGAELLLLGPHAGEVDRLMKEGVGLTAIHWATAVLKQNYETLGKKYETYLGGTWLHFTGITVATSPLVRLDEKHPICRGWEPYDLRDEFYFTPIITPPGKPLLRIKVKDKEHIVGWTVERAAPYKGRGFGTTLGHFHDNFGRAPFRKMLVNGILWTAGLEVPAGGAPVKVSPDDLKVPEKK